MIVEYILDPQDSSRSSHPKTIPSYITDGGYWINPDGSEKMIGIVNDSVPDSLTTFTLEELQVRQRAIHAKYPMIVSPEDHTEMNDTQVNAAIKAWVDAR